MSIPKAIYTVLNADSGITDELSTYDFGGGAAPSIFTFEPAPENAETPFIVIAPVSSSSGGADRSTKAGVLSIDIKLWEKKGRSEETLRQLADKIWFAMDRAILADDYFDSISYCLATPPYRLLDPDGFVGFIISCRILVRKGV